LKPDIQYVIFDIHANAGNLPMKAAKQKKLEANGWMVGSTADF
jgi:hypothetical protein